jgi:hypothetical protein
MVDSPKTVNINPHSFVKYDIIDISLDEVIDRFLLGEEKRSAEDPCLEQRPQSLSYRYLPKGLAQSLDLICTEKCLRQFLVTRCASHHIIAWYDSLDIIRDIVQLYQVISSKADGYPDIWQRMSSDAFKFTNILPARTASRKSSFHSIAFVVSHLVDLADALGVTPVNLFAVGLCWSIGTNESGLAVGTGRRYLSPEVKHFMTYLKERLLTLEYFSSLLKLWENSP